MPNNVAVSITADVADLQVKRAIMSAELKAATKDLNDFAKTARTSGQTDALRTSMLGSASAAQQAKNSISFVDKELKALGPTLDSVSHGSAGVTREFLVMGRELSRGNFNRMAGSATILAGRLGLLTPAFLGTAAAALAIAAPFLALAVAAEQGSEELAKFQNGMEATNGYAGVTISQLQAMSAKLAAFAHEGVGTATETMLKLASSGQFTSKTLLLVGEDATRMAGLTGESADKFIDQFGKMGDGVAKFAKEYEDKYHQLTAAQYEYIRQLEEQGDKEGAEYALAKDVYEYLGTQAPQNLGYLEAAWSGVRDAISGAWDSLKAFGRDSNVDQLSTINAQIEALKSSGGRGHNGGSDEVFVRGHDTGQTELQMLERQKAAIEGVEAAQEKVAATRAASAQTQTAGVDAAAKLKDQFESSKTSGEKLRDAIKGINEELAKAVAADPGGKAKYEQEAAAARAQAEKSDTPHARKAKGGPSEVSEWTEQLHAQEVASGEYFKDQTAAELAFWQSKLGLVTAGSKQWLEVQGHIYEASKTLAHQAYQEQIAADNDKIAADKDNWSKEKADWNEKLAFIKVTFGEMSTEYRDAYREWEALDREHAVAAVREQEQASAKALESLKKQLEDAKKVREDDARTQETLIKAKSDSTPFGDVAAAAQEGAIKAQLIQQEIADLATLQSAKDADLQKSINDAQADATKYQAAIEAKANADREYAAQHQTLEAQMRAQSIATILSMQQAYGSYIGSTVSTTIAGFDGLISKQKSWAQVGISIYGSLVRTAEQQFAKMVTNWIIQHVLMSAAQRAALASQTAAQAAASGTQAAATLASSKAQVVALVGLAGAGGVASMAAAPWPLDMGAPAFGAAMAAAAGSLGSFAAGTNFVPSDMIAQIHAGERIIPAADNRQLMDMTQRGGGNDNGGGAGAGGGDTHTHNWNLNAMDGASVKKMFMDNRGAIAAALREHSRMGGR